MFSLGGSTEPPEPPLDPPQSFLLAARSIGHFQVALNLLMKASRVRAKFLSWKLVVIHKTYLDCSQSPYFSVGFSRAVHFDGTAAILVCKRERDLGRVSQLPRGAEVGVSIVGDGKRKIFFPPPPNFAPLSLTSLDTLPRWRSILQTKMAAAPSKHTGLKNPTEK